MVIEKIEEMKIQKLEDLVYQHVSKDKRIVQTKITSLTPPGENFGSSILKVDLTLEDEHKLSDSLSMVVKMIPESELFQALFNVQVTFKLETAFYEIIVPTLQNFQRERGVTDVIDFFPKFYGARINLDDGDEVDQNGVILLENLKVSGKLF